MKAKLQDKGKTGIYLIRNLINGKVYIGKSKCIHKRIKQHITNLNIKNLNSENEHFIRAWTKYGRNNFAYSILEELPLDEQIISKKEIEYIDKYESLNPEKGYNKRYDSSTGLIVSKETRKKLSDSQKLRFKNPEERKKCSHNYYKNNPEIAKAMGKKVGNIIRKYKIGKFDYDTLELLEIFNSREELKLKNPDYYTQAIVGCCDGTKKSYKGFKWKYISIKTNEIIHRELNYKNKNKIKI
jgi:group I intron endonuclease